MKYKISNSNQYYWTTEKNYIIPLALKNEVMSTSIIDSKEIKKSLSFDNRAVAKFEDEVLNNLIRPSKKFAVFYEPGGIVFKADTESNKRFEKGKVLTKKKLFNNRNYLLDEEIKTMFTSKYDNNRIPYKMNHDDEFKKEYSGIYQLYDNLNRFFSLHSKISKIHPNHILDIQTVLNKDDNSLSYYMIFEYSEYTIRNGKTRMSFSDIDSNNRLAIIGKFEDNDIELLTLVRKMIDGAVVAPFLIPLLYSTRKMEKKLGADKLFRMIKIQGHKKVREVWEPVEEIKFAQSIALEHYNLIFNGDKRYIKNQFAYIQKLDIYKNMLLHKDNNYFFKTDITKYFDNINRTDIARSFPYVNDLVGELRDIFFASVTNPETGGVYQGIPLSGMISNFVIRNSMTHLQNALNAIQNEFIVPINKKNPDLGTKVIVTRYVATIYSDDILISSNFKIDREFMINLTEDCLSSNSSTFKLSEKKTILYSNNRRKALGTAINHKNEIIKPRPFLKKVGFRPFLEKLAHGKIEWKALNRKVVGRLNECIKYEVLAGTLGPLHRYIHKFDDTGEFYKKLRQKNMLILDKQGVLSYE